MPQLPTPARRKNERSNLYGTSSGRTFAARGATITTDRRGFRVSYFFRLDALDLWVAVTPELLSEPGASGSIGCEDIFVCALLNDAVGHQHHNAIGVYDRA